MIAFCLRDPSSSRAGLLHARAQPLRPLFAVRERVIARSRALILRAASRESGSRSRSSSSGAQRQQPAPLNSRARRGPEVNCSIPVVSHANLVSAKAAVSTFWKYIRAAPLRSPRTPSYRSARGSRHSRNSRSADTPAAAARAPADRTRRYPAAACGRTCNTRPHRATSHPSKRSVGRRLPRRESMQTRHATFSVALSVQALHAIEPSLRIRRGLARSQFYASHRAAVGHDSAARSDNINH